MADPTPEAMASWDKRHLGKDQKGLGYFGMLQNGADPRAQSSELSIQVNLGGKEVEMPSLVPTLTRSEIKTVLNLKEGEQMPRKIVDKAVAFARQRMKEGKPLFAQKGEQGPLPGE